MALPLTILYGASILIVRAVNPAPPIEEEDENDDEEDAEEETKK